jgi:hypothetical protein
VVADAMGMGKSLVRLFIVALLVCPWQQAMAADPCAEGKLRPATIVDGNKLLLKWSGTVNEGMGPAIAAAFDAYKLRTKTVELSLQSCGGRTDYMAAVIGVLHHIKNTHKLTTVVERGAMCASACIPIFLASDRRTAALSSVWFFHRSWRHQLVGDVDGIITRQPGRSSLGRFLEQYYASAGVSRGWLSGLKDIIENGAGYWQTGRDLWGNKSGIITETISDVQAPDMSPIYVAPAPACTTMCRG